MGCFSRTIQFFQNKAVNCLQKRMNMTRCELVCEKERRDGFTLGI
jgi:hypothetical protein